MILQRTWRSPQEVTEEGAEPGDIGWAKTLPEFVERASLSGPAVRSIALDVEPGPCGGLERDVPVRLLLPPWRLLLELPGSALILPEGMSLTEILGLLTAAAAGGAINAVAGGGTLVTFPALLLFGTPPIVANATSTLALVIGTSGGIYGYRQHLDPVKPWLWRFALVSTVGGLLGAILLTRTSNQTFSKLVPFLIFFATVLFLSQGAFRRFAWLHDPGAQHARHGVWGAILFQLAVAVYGGYFGAGIGILMLASLGFLGLNDIHQMNTLKTILASLINVVAAVWFMFAGLIHWTKAGVMTAGALAGYFLGSHYAQRIAQQRVRQIITLIGFLISAVTFYEQFLR